MGTTRFARSSLAILLLLAGSPATANCGSEPRLHALDFWLGHWVVSWEGEFVGHNVIERALDDCAVTEHWLDVQGRAAFSLFWYDRGEDRWKQVFLTDRALDVGATKEKAEVTSMTTPTIRIPGESGMDLWRSLPVLRPHLIVVTGDPEHALEAMELQPEGYVVKPVQPVAGRADLRQDTRDQ